MRSIWAVLGVLLASSWAQVGDFAPLEVGNRWIYACRYHSWDNVVNRERFEILRSIEILQVTQEADHKAWRVQLTDSVFNYIRHFDSLGSTEIPDSVFRSEGVLQEFPGDSLAFQVPGNSHYRGLEAGMLKNVFRSHTYPDTSLINGWKVEIRTGSSLSQATSLAVYGRNIGMTEYSYNFATRFVGFNWVYSLVEFHGAPVSVRQDRFSGDPNGIRSRGATWNRDVLGRRGTGRIPLAPHRP